MKPTAPWTLPELLAKLTRTEDSDILLPFKEANGTLSPQREQICSVRHKQQSTALKVKVVLEKMKRGKETHFVLPPCHRDNSSAIVLVCIDACGRPVSKYSYTTQSGCLPVSLVICITCFLMDLK